MVSLQLSGIASSATNGNLTTAGAIAPPAAPNASGRAVPTAPANRGSFATEAAGGTPESGEDTSSALTPRVPSSAPPLGADASAVAIGTQMVLVFDDQTRSMTVKILDILTQKVEQPASLPLANAAAQSTISGQGGSGALVDTKA